MSLLLILTFNTHTPCGFCALVLLGGMGFSHCSSIWHLGRVSNTDTDPLKEVLFEQLAITSMQHAGVVCSAYSFIKVHEEDGELGTGSGWGSVLGVLVTWRGDEVESQV